MENREPLLLDVKEKALPLLEAIYQNHPSPTENMHWWKQQLDQAEALLLVTPEHNASYSGALKNTLDYFYDEYKGKPMAIIAVSSGVLGGVNAAVALQHFCLKVGGLLMPNYLITPKVSTLFTDDRLTDPAYQERLDKFLKQFMEFSKMITQQN